MPSSATVLAFDLGATSGRAILGRLDSGSLKLREVHRFPNEPVQFNNELHWDMPRLWRDVRIGLEAGAGQSGDSLRSVGVDAWGVDYALLDESGILLENPYHYRDRRTEGKMERATGILGAERIYDATGIQFLPINTLYQLYAASEKTPRLLKTAESLVTIPDLVNYWLTGILACEYTNATTTQFLDWRTKSWDASLLGGLGIPSHFLGGMIEPGTLIGGLRPELMLLGSLSLTAVSAPACHDTGSAIAAIRSGGSTAFLSSGTWSLLGTEVSEAVVNSESRRLNFTNEGGVGGTFRLLKNIAGLWLLEECKRAWDAAGEKYSYEELMGMAAAAPAWVSMIDPDDPRFIAPRSMPGAIEAYCAQTGQRIPQTAGAVARTILDSLALKYRVVLEELETLVGTRFDRIRIIGGGCRNAVLNQLTADVTRRTVLAGPAEATALGNIAMQLVAIGAVRSVDEARDVIENSFQAEKFEPLESDAWEAAYSAFKSILYTS